MIRSKLLRSLVPLLAAAFLVWPVARLQAAAPGGVAEVAPATQAADQAQFLRFVDNGRSGGALQTAVAHFRNKDGLRVDLVAAVHIGEKSYYEGLDKSFADYDAVLYELVKPKDAGVPQPGAKSDNPINQFQHFLKDSLDLDFQLDDINYGRANFVHADLTAEEF